MGMKSMHNILMSLAKLSQFHNWVLVVIVVDFGGDRSFEIEIIV
jgi:hypothetical protein